MRITYLVAWRSTEDCQKYFKSIGHEGQRLETSVRLGLEYGSKIRFGSEEDVDKFIKDYNVRLA